VVSNGLLDSVLIPSSPFTFHGLLGAFLFEFFYSKKRKLLQIQRNTGDDVFSTIPYVKICFWRKNVFFNDLGHLRMFIGHFLGRRV
jgi:hypothetical protein